ncbi:nicotinamide-nucleotide amidase [Aeromonas sp. R6-2]|uniref:nicotinamide-nucleotide amidase n=1 Tax=unclassified Aeromonas TaxID=257493 RepID=UPI0034A5803F
MHQQQHNLELAARLGAALQARALWVATAESCTGGGIATVITEIAGSSGWFDRSFVTYTNEAKQEMLGVQAATLERHGAVSESVVLEMARGALARSRADLAVAVSGIAGPGGGSELKPVGTVWFAWACRDGRSEALLARFDGDRHGVRQQVVGQALSGLLALVTQNRLDTV